MSSPEQCRRQGTCERPITGVAIIGLVLGAVIALIIQRQHQDRLTLQHSREQFRQNALAGVKQGDSSALVMDSELLRMLANDADCKRIVTRLNFAATAFNTEDSEAVAALSNVTSITFYSTTGTVHALLGAESLPITDLCFEGTDLQAASYLTLKNFPHLKRVRFEQLIEDQWVERLKVELPNTAIDATRLSSQRPEMP